MEIINNTPVNSGLGDNLKVAFDKVKSNFAELYSLVEALAAPVTETSQLTNDGEDGVNSFITALDIPNTYTIADIIGLQSTLNNLQNAINVAVDDISVLQGDSAALNASIASLSALIVTQNALIASQNLSISTINAEIIEIKQRLDILEA